MRWRGDLAGGSKSACERVGGINLQKKPISAINFSRDRLWSGMGLRKRGGKRTSEKERIRARRNIVTIVRDRYLPFVTSLHN